MPRESVFEKVARYKELLKPVVGEKPDREVKLMLCHCHYYRTGRYKSLTKEERILYDFLLKTNLKPHNMYEKFVFLESPEHVQNLLREKKIGIREAQSRSYASKRQVDSSESKEFMDDIRKIIGGVEWPALNTTIKN